MSQPWRRFWRRAAGLPILALVAIPGGRLLAQLPPGIGPNNLEYTLGAFGVLGLVTWLLQLRTERRLERIEIAANAAREALRSEITQRVDALLRMVVDHGESDSREFGEATASLRGVLASVARLREDLNGLSSKLTDQLYGRYDPQVAALESRMNRLELRLDTAMSSLRDALKTAKGDM